ncbi:MAG: hypothetical protein ACE14V_15490 [bacterium]
MNNLPKIFENCAKSILEKYPNIQTKWDDNGTKRSRLTIYKQDENGFDIIVEAETYGLYPFAGGWHGAPWEIGPTDTTPEKLCEQFMGFIRSLLCTDAMLEVKYASGFSYKWILTYPTEQGIESEVTGLLFYNYFGKRTNRIFQNQHLPPRYK